MAMGTNSRSASVNDNAAMYDRKQFEVTPDELQMGYRKWFRPEMTYEGT